MVDLFVVTAQKGVGYGLTNIEVPEYGKPKLRVKAWRTVDQDGHRRPQYYEESKATRLRYLLDGPEIAELYDGYWQPRACPEADA